MFLTKSKDGQESRSGCSQAEDVAQQHAIPACPVEDSGADAGELPAVPQLQAAACCLPDLRHVPAAAGHHPGVSPV
jgi:hypothetical protein